MLEKAAPPPLCPADVPEPLVCLAGNANFWNSVDEVQNFLFVFRLEITGTNYKITFI